MIDPREFAIEPDRVLVVFSDIEMGAGGVIDDFPQTAWLAELILRYNRPPWDGIDVDIVFNGDTFDLLKTSWEGSYPHQVTAGIAVDKMQRIAEAHPAFFAGLRDFLHHRTAERQVHFVVGNHDAELLFPEVQALLREALVPERTHFPGFSAAIGDVYFEHGSQHDPMFHMTEPMFLQHRGEDILALPWGAVALLDVAMPLQSMLFHHDRLRPRQRVFELMPELRDLLVNAFWRYWTRDWWQGFLDRSDPVKRVTWTMLRELAHRFNTHDAGVHLSVPTTDRMMRSDRHRVHLFGHVHRAGWWSHGDQKVLQTGAMRNEFAIDAEGRITRMIPKVYAEVFLRGGSAVRSHLVEVDGPPPPPGYIPDTIFGVLDQVRPMLGTHQDRQLAADAQREQEAREAGGS